VFTKQSPVSQFLIIPVSKFVLEPLVCIDQFWCKKNKLLGTSLCQDFVKIASIVIVDPVIRPIVLNSTILNAMESNTSSDSDDSEPPSYTWILLLATIIRRRWRGIASSNRTWTGQEYVDNLLNCGNPTRIRNQLHVHIDCLALQP
jgi:hypothetical protein